MNRNDLRAQRTFHKINKNFKILMGEVGYQKLNVAMITNKANMNRSTYYSHFNDKRHLYEYHLGLLIEAFTFEDFPKFFGKKELSQEQLVEMTNQFEDALIQVRNDKDFVLAMMDVEDVHEMTETYLKHSNYKDENLVVQTNEGPVTVSTSLIITYALGMFVSTVRWWLLEDTPLKPREIANLLISVLQMAPLK